MAVRVGIFVICVSFICTAEVIAQHRTKLIIKPHIPEAILQRQVEETTSKFLSAMNEAYSYKIDISGILTQLAISESGRKAIQSFFRDGYYECVETRIELPLNRIYRTLNYEIAGVRLRAEGKSIELARIEYDQSGTIVDFGFDKQSSYQYESFSRSGFAEEGDVSPEFKSKIRDVINQLGIAYSKKDIAHLKNVFSDDAVIITGAEIKIGDIPKRRKDDGISYNFYRAKTGYVYRLVRQTKEQYLSNLRRLFDQVSSLKITLDGKPDIAKHPTIDNVYGAIVKQTWESSTYTDEGYIFLSIDFRKNPPVLKARRWMPEASFSSEEAVQLLLQTIAQ